MGLLKKPNHIAVDENGYISLTQDGKEIADKILERHRVLTGCLVRLGVDEATASEDACRFEHVISDTTFEKIKEFMQK